MELYILININIIKEPIRLRIYPFHIFNIDMIIVSEEQFQNPERLLKKAGYVEKLGQESFGVEGKCIQM